VTPCSTVHLGAQLEKLLRSQRAKSSEELLARAEEAEQQLDAYEDMAAHEVRVWGGSVFVGADAF
jgi:hypothetical protein